MQVAIRDGTDSGGSPNLVKQFVDLKDIKESHPVEMAEYAVTRKINDTPAFGWWVPYTLKKRDRIITVVMSWITKTTHKYGIEVPSGMETTCGVRHWRRRWRTSRLLGVCCILIYFMVL